MTNLIYHDAASSTGGDSPFDLAIMQMVKRQKLRIACPYISLDYLARMIAPAADWRLLTDLQELLSSQAEESRKAFLGFISNHRKKVHHCPGLHAKVLIAGPTALIGSANFTRSGIAGRVEVSARFNKCKEVEDLSDWFDNLWRDTDLPENRSIREFADSLPEPAGKRSSGFLVSRFSGVRSKLSNPSQSRPTHVRKESTNDEVRLLVGQKSPGIQSLVSQLVGMLETEDVSATTTRSDGGDVRHWLNKKLFSEMELRKRFVRLVLTVPEGSIADPDFEWNTSDRRDRGKVRVHVGVAIPDKIAAWIGIAKRHAMP